MKKLAYGFSVSIILSSFMPALAQSSMEDLFVDESEAALEDSRKLVKGYIAPLMKGLGLGMANGWYNTAKPHKTLGFDITVTVNGAYIPDKDAFYNIEELELERVELVSVDNDLTATSAPTVFGPDVEVMYRYTAQDNIASRTFQGPSGMGLENETFGNVIPVPMAQIGIGLIKNTDIKIRWIPDIQQDDFKFNYFGIGVMHDVKQHIPGLKELPFDFSAFAGYTNLDFELDLSEDASTEGQKATLNSNALTIQGLISKKLALLTVYGGLGFNYVNSELNILGEYDVNNDGFVDITDPIKEMGVPAGGPRATVGARLKLLVLTFHADYTVQEYDVLTVGVGLNVR